MTVYLGPLGVGVPSHTPPGADCIQPLQERCLPPHPGVWKAQPGCQDLATLQGTCRAGPVHMWGHKARLHHGPVLLASRGRVPFSSGQQCNETYGFFTDLQIDPQSLVKMQKPRVTSLVESSDRSVIFGYSTWPSRENGQISGSVLCLSCICLFCYVKHRPLNTRTLQLFRGILNCSE